MKGKRLRNKYDYRHTPYHFTVRESGSWRIGFGGSSFLIANGSGFSIKEGRELFKRLEDDWAGRVKAKRPIK